MDSGPLRWVEVSDGDFVAELVPISKKLERARQIWPSDPKTARALVVEHFARRRSPRWLFDHRRRKARTFSTRNYFWGTAVRPEEAEAILGYRVRDPNSDGGYHSLGRRIEWSRGQINSYGSSGWLVLHFWYWALAAAAGYSMTRRREYARVFERFWRRWHEDFPFFVDLEVVQHGSSFNESQDSCMRAGRRLLVLTDVLYSGLLEELRPPVAFEVLKYVWFVSRQYLRLPRTSSGRYRYRPDNHNLFDTGTTPYCLGTMYPEFAHSRALLELGRNSIRRHIRSSIHDDGISVEHSSRYAWYIANMYVQAVEVARLNGDILLRPPQERKLRRFLWTLVELSAPDGRLIPYGDCQPPPESLQLVSYGALFHDRELERRAREMGVNLGRLHAPARVKVEGPPPGIIRRPWKVFRHSGMVLVRDGRGRKSSALWLIADPRGRTVHGHLDFTSLQLWCCGEPLLLDTSGYSYRVGKVVSSERAFYYSPFGHSLLTVDDYSPVPMSRLGNVKGGWWGSELPEATVSEIRINGVHGRVACGHRAYPEMEVRRHLEFDLAKGYLDVHDRAILNRRPRRARTYRQWFHLGFGMVPRVAKGRTSATVSGDTLTATFEWESERELGVTAKVSSLAARAASVFGLATPYLLVAAVKSDAREVSIRCRIRWAR